MVITDKNTGKALMSWIAMPGEHQKIVDDLQSAGVDAAYLPRRPNYATPKQNPYHPATIRIDPAHLPKVQEIYQQQHEDEIRQYNETHDERGRRTAPRVATRVTD